MTDQTTDDLAMLHLFATRGATLPPDWNATPAYWQDAAARLAAAMNRLRDYLPDEFASEMLAPMLSVGGLIAATLAERAVADLTNATTGTIRQ